jgi:hydrogenase maturation protein HypF
MRMVAASVQPSAMEIRVRGRVQGVGFRPTVWRYARELGLSGEVLNDANGVLIRIAGLASAIETLAVRLRQEPPPLARIERIECRPFAGTVAPGFRIVDSMTGAARTEITPDAAVCPACAREVIDPSQRRHGYAFANCTHCGPRLSIVRHIPYDRAATTMAMFPLCDDCRREYEDPADRRFHAEAIACLACGPRPRLVRFDEQAVSFGHPQELDDLDVACALLLGGHILAVKGLGGHQLACDATNADAVARLRAGKRRETKPFAVMARDLDVIRRYCTLRPDEARQLVSPEAPIVLLRAAGEQLPDAVAPGLATLGFMLPTTPLHLLLLRRIDRPVVMTSGNITDEPQIIDDDEALARLGVIADFALVHDRPIAVRLDDSVVRSMDGSPRVLRRGRGFAPAAIPLPSGFATAPDLLAAGGELKCTFCLLTDGKAVLSQHIGDLEDARTLDDYRRNLDHYAALFDHVPAAFAVDSHPDYLSSKLTCARARDAGLPLVEVQHHHAHIAACLAENMRPLAALPVLGIVLDGLGWGDDGTLWGGEFMLADYRKATRLGTFKPVAMPGGSAAVREPWRNLYAHLMAAWRWDDFPADFAALELCRFLAGKPHATLDAMIRKELNAPMASSCGRLFDAVAAALEICRDRQEHEGEAASRLEAMVCERTMRDEDAASAYPFTIDRATALPFIEPRTMWRALLDDLVRGTSSAVMAARFHKGLARAVASMAVMLAQDRRCDTVALSGGCFQNAVLFEATARQLRDAGFAVLTHTMVPTNDGGLALGQAVIGASRLMAPAGGRG